MTAEAEAEAEVEVTAEVDAEVEVVAEEVKVVVVEVERLEARGRGTVRRRRVETGAAWRWGGRGETPRETSVRWTSSIQTWRSFHSLPRRVTWMSSSVRRGHVLTLILSLGELLVMMVVMGVVARHLAFHHGIAQNRAAAQKTQSIKMLSLERGRALCAVVFPRVQAPVSSYTSRRGRGITYGVSPPASL